MEVLAAFQSKFRVNELRIFETQCWIWSLRPHQGTLGASILSLKRECRNFGQLTIEEFRDLGRIIKVMEHTLAGAFQYDAINYLMLMMFDKHVHYHVFPRYEEPIRAFGQTWNDNNWPGTVDLVGDSLDRNTLKKILQLLKRAVCNSAEV